MTKYRKSLTEAYREVQERELTPKELKRREEIAKDLPIKDFEKRYGKEKGMQVKMATATKMAKKESFELRELSTQDALVVRARQLSQKKLGLKARIEIANKIEIKSPSLFKYYRALEMKGDKNSPAVKKFDKQLMSALAKKFGQDVAKKTEKALKEETELDETKITINNIDKSLENKVMMIVKSKNLNISLSKTNDKKSIIADGDKEDIKTLEKALKEEIVIDEAVADLFVKKGDVNKIAIKIAKSAKGLGLKSGVMGNQVRVKGSQKNVNDFMRTVIGKSSLGGPSEVGASNPQIDKMLNKQLKKETIKEDGHTDVASAVRSCKTITEDANEIMGKLSSMSPEDSLPTWWTNKLAIASNSMNKMRDYILNPIQENVIQEAPGDLEDMKKVVDELKKASQRHLGQSKRVQAHIGMMEKGE
mgnify:FL=1